MIVINTNWLLKIGMPTPVVAALQDAPGLLLCLTSNIFGGGPHGHRFTSALLLEPPPRTLVLVGMTDRYGASSGMVSGVIELCTSASTESIRAPSAAERPVLLRALAEVDHWTAAAIAAAVFEHVATEAACPTSAAALSEAT